ncbi:bifunctional diaminohydroxyphosphoribosylaminopyrimidine deaminase/5-amino-6-(5-phosphoribosylamino)uracil reductase RibD, partial [bacterium]|nr:bifunctional diaminohydroxyphosphoribosylaminopyrimidine deaminase/5-amino-6-(5-phosphoribosylamino)uracil reductase RibD [bacterium]
MSGRTESPYTQHQFRFMRRALALAGKGRFSVWPNPRVGCVITQPGTSAEADSRIIGEGYHSKKGEPHAERMALASCAESPRGGTMYVTLEPCCHHGATPPCTEAILEAGIQQVFIAIRDPFPQVNGKGVEILRKQGIQVDVGLLEEEAWYENRFFFHRHQQGTPWVLLKTAITLDGKCATASGHSKWITSEAARAHVHKIRGEMDAIAIGIGTLKADDSLLTARIPEAETALFVPPVRIVLDPFLDLPLRSKMLASVEQAPVWVFCAKTAPNANQKQIESAGANVIPVSGTGPRLDLKEI